MIDKPDKAGTEEERKATLRFLEFVHKLHNPLISFAVGPHAPYTCGPDTLLWARDLAEQEKYLVNIHIAETRGEQAQFEKMERDESQTIWIRSASSTTESWQHTQCG